MKNAYMKRMACCALVGIGSSIVVATCFTHCSWLYGVEDEAQHSKPFAGLAELAKKQWGGWDGNQTDLTREFNAERAKLGDRFEKELLVFVGEDIYKHKRIPEYIDSGAPRPYLSICILEQGISLCRRGKAPESDLDLVTMSILASVRCEKAGFHALASSHKKEAEVLLAAKPILQGACPAMDADEQKLYESIVVRVEKNRSN